VPHEYTTRCKWSATTAQSYPHRHHAEPSSGPNPLDLLLRTPGIHARCVTSDVIRQYSLVGDDRSFPGRVPNALHRSDCPSVFIGFTRRFVVLSRSAEMLTPPGR